MKLSLYVLNITLRFFTKFISHTHFCSSNTEKEKPIARSQSTTESVALTLWSKTLLNKVKDQVTVENIDEEALVKRIRRKWYTMSDSFQTCWHQTAKVLLELSNASSTLRKQEHLAIEGGETQITSPVSVKRNGAVSRSQLTKHPNYHSQRDTKGRWSSKEDKARVSCDDCELEFSSEWKLNRHKTTKKHVDMKNRRSNLNIPCDRIEEELDQYTSDSQGGIFGLGEHEDRITEGINEREILYESPCDIIMEDQSK